MSKFLKDLKCGLLEAIQHVSVSESNLNLSYFFRNERELGAGKMVRLQDVLEIVEYAHTLESAVELEGLDVLELICQYKDYLNDDLDECQTDTESAIQEDLNDLKEFL